MHRTARLGIGLLLLGLCGCQSTPDQDKFFRNDIDRRSGWHHLGMYAKDVGLDALDVFTLNVGAGKPGPFLFSANLHATKYAEIGFGSWTGYKAGLLGRGFGVWREERNENGFALFPIQNYSVYAARVPHYGTSTLREKHLDVQGENINLDSDRHWGDFGGYVHFLFVGFDIGFSPFELADFAFGLFGNYPNPAWVSTSDMPWDIGVDIADDDTRVSIYDDKLGRYRHNAYSMWPTIWPTTFGVTEEVEGSEWMHAPSRNPGTVSVGGAYGGTHGTQH